MLIDVHGHFDAETLPIRINTYAGVCGIDLVLISNRTAAVDAGDLDEAAANLACLDGCRATPHLRPLYWARPGRPDSDVYAVAGALATEPFVGLLLSPSAANFDLADARLDAYLEAASRAEKPVVVCVGNDARSAPSAAYELARRNPTVPIVLCACGATTERRNEMTDVVRWALERHDANLYIDTSHATAPAIKALVQAIGTARVLFGSNALSYDMAHIPRHIALLQELRQLLAPREFAEIAGGAAAQIFRLAPPTS